MPRLVVPFFVVSSEPQLGQRSKGGMLDIGDEDGSHPLFYLFFTKNCCPEDYRGYIASKNRYFYGIRVQLLCTDTGIPVEFVFLPGEANDTRGLSALPLNLPAGSDVYSDAGYTDYQAEDNLKQTDAITLQVMRKRNSKRPDPPWVAYIKQHIRHPIETVVSGITQRFPKSIHAVTMDGFLLKVTAFILAFTRQAAFIA